VKSTGPVVLDACVLVPMPLADTLLRLAGCPGLLFPRLQLLGLDPKATYALGSIEGKAAEGTPAKASGAWWMNRGIEVALRGDFQGAAFRLDSK
jgi:hypothetical protein